RGAPKTWQTIKNHSLNPTYWPSRRTPSFPAAHPQALARQNPAKLQNPADLRNRKPVPPLEQKSRSIFGCCSIPNMNRLLPLILAMLAASTQKTLSTDQSQDEAEIRNLVQTRQQEAWNRHDAKAYAALFTEDGDL